MAVKVGNIVDDADVGMVQLRSSAGLAQEAVEGLAVIGEVVGNELQRHVAAEARIFCFVNHAHAAATELPQEAVVGNGLADQSWGRGFHVGGNVRLRREVRSTRAGGKLHDEKKCPTP